MWMSWGLLLFVLAFSVGCAAPEPPPEVTLIHGTDSHLFEEPGRLGSDGQAISSKVRELQEKQNRDAFKAFLKAAGTLGDSSRRVVILTGDFGIDPRWSKPKNPSGPHDRATQVKDLADDLKEGAVSDVYVVAGNNDLEDERTTPEALEYVGQFFQDVGKALDGTRVRLLDLTACYHGKGTCTADIPGVSDSKVGLVGFPSYSFKNRSQEAANANRDAQKTQIEKFAELISAAQAKGRKVIVLSHVPELDDPFTLARQRFTESPQDTTKGSAGKNDTPERPAASTWNVTPEVFRRWKELTESPTVLAVLAGHFHDSHREIYRRPYRWSSPSSLRADPSKLFLAPPLAVKLQDTSPIQARGFSVLRLRGDELSQQLHWFNAETSAFEPEPLPSPPGAYPEPPFVLRWLWSPIEWLVRLLSPTVLFLWNLGGDLKPLERMVVLAIAWLLAFLTVAKLWTVPKLPAELTGFSEVRTTPEAAAEAAKALAAETPLTNNLGKTALSGLGGLAAISLLDNTFWEKGGSATKGYYVVWFVAMFSVLLVGFAILRGIVEACRIRIADEHRPPAWRPRGGNECVCAHHARYWGRRFWLWVLSWRPTLLVFFDTSLSVLLGDNVLRNAVLSDTIAKLQHSMIQAIARARDSITVSIRRALIVNEEFGRDLDEGAVRVNVSVLSPDGGSVSYVSWAPGSLARVFDRHSLAWVAVTAGEARWWRKAYDDHDLTDKIVIFNNVGAKIADREGLLYLREFFQTRGAQDYEAFIVLPVPRRAANGDYWKAGIHISFSKEKYFEALWPSLDLHNRRYDASPPDDDASPPDDYASPPEGALSKEALTAFYAAAPRVLEETMLHSPELRAVLNESIDVIAEILRRFNAVVYQTYVKPRILR